MLKSTTEAYDRSVQHAEQITRLTRQAAASDDMMARCALTVESLQRVQWESRNDPVSDHLRLMNNTDQLNKFLDSLES